MTKAFREAAAARIAAERARLDAILHRATPVDGCGPAIPIAPARGPQIVVTPRRMVPDAKDATGWKVEELGWRGFNAVRATDIFDDLARRAAKRKDAPPFTPGQVAVGRLYRDLVERHDAGGMRCASLEAGRGGSPSGGGEFIDAFIEEGRVIELLRRRIGHGVAMPVRRVRPSARGGDGARMIHDRVLVDDICLHGRSFQSVLERHGWTKTGRNVVALQCALAACLDRMQFHSKMGLTT
ncbi:hypothetical protein [Paracoccus sulfuroxidans]|uniref:Uncharacterized protein n=1 Tax=Paracoccus sulfuroxidans TaxID=384678 RepID=A0A562NQ44_9RHOB|nr:hypothetical protein [Paracoccus sulfuroxidans]AZV00332.1 hypothetical protein psul1_p24 [Paracoccus phage vB_PsuS_Psul1]TWI34314.1 hypothetical protein IQ24_01829 [Paracoccus sulfuroxidans]